MQLLMGSTDQEIGALNRENNEVGTASVSKIIINDTIDLFFLNYNQQFGNFKP